MRHPNIHPLIAQKKKEKTVIHSIALKVQKLPHGAMMRRDAAALLHGAHGRYACAPGPAA